MSQNGADLMKSPGFHFAEASLLPLKYFQNPAVEKELNLSEMNTKPMF